MHDLANLIDDDGLPLWTDGGMKSFFGCAANGAQWQILKLMLEKFAYLLRPGSTFDLEKKGSIYEVELASIRVIGAASQLAQENVESAKGKAAKTTKSGSAVGGKAGKLTPESVTDQIAVASISVGGTASEAGPSGIDRGVKRKKSSKAKVDTTDEETDDATDSDKVSNNGKDNGWVG
jgi:hypothetical protein